MRAKLLTPFFLLLIVTPLTFVALFSAQKNVSLYLFPFALFIVAYYLIIEHMLKVLTQAKALHHHIYRKYHDVEKYIQTDKLTNVYNRQFFESILPKEIKHAEKEGRTFSLLLIDIIEFKKINSFYNYKTGDFVLSSFSKRLKTVVGKDSLIARLSSNEFVIILREHNNVQRLKTISKRIIHTANKPYVMNGHAFKCSIKVGLASYPKAGHTKEELLRHANFALSEAKESHHAWMSFGKHLKTKMNKKITIEKDLKEALQHNQFFCLFQPQINLSSKTLFGFEVLIRWQHPSAGVIIPNDFIPIAEKMGLAEKINQYLLHYVLSRLGRFKPHQKRLTISVNISPCVIHFEQHINELINIVNHYQLPKNLSLTFEITESEFLGNINEKDPLLKKVKRQLKQHNISLAIDDFGKDQSSFNRLVQCQFDILKIDKAFIDHLHKNNTLATAIIKAILTMSKELNISVIAEGVENKSQLNCLKKLGSTIIQGYYYYRPLLENDALELLHKPSLH